MTKSPEIDVQTEAQGSCLHRLRIQVPSSRITREFQHYYRSVGKRVRIPGFRPGHIPPEVLRKRLGEKVAVEAREHAVEHVLREAFRASGLRILRTVDFDAAKVEVEEGRPLELELLVESWPEIELPPWEELRVPAEDVQPRDEEVEQTVRGLAREHPRFDDAEGQALDEEHVAICDLRYEKEGEAGPTAEGLQLGLTAPLYGCDADAFRAAMQGVQAGEERHLPIRFLEGFEREDWVGQEGEAVLQVRQIARPRPATEEELTADVGLDSPASLRDRIRQQIAREKEGREQERRIGEMLELMSRLRPFDLPARLVEEEVDAALEAQRQRFREQGLEETQAAARAEEAREQLAEGSRRRLRAFFLVRRVAEAERVAVTRQDMQRAFEALAERHQVDPASVAAYYKEQGMLQGLQDDILEGKVRAFLAAKLAARDAADAGTAEAAVAGEDEAR